MHERAASEWRPADPVHPAIEAQIDPRVHRMAEKVVSVSVSRARATLAVLIQRRYPLGIPRGVENLAQMRRLAAGDADESNFMSIQSACPRCALAPSRAAVDSNIRPFDKSFSYHLRKVPFGRCNRCTFLSTLFSSLIIHIPLSCLLLTFAAVCRLSKWLNANRRCLPSPARSVHVFVLTPRSKSADHTCALQPLDAMQSVLCLRFREIYFN